MALSKRDYERIAVVIAWSQSVTQIADGLASVFAADNPRFDRDRFLLACGVIPPGAQRDAEDQTQ